MSLSNNTNRGSYGCNVSPADQPTTASQALRRISQTMAALLMFTGIAHASPSGSHRASAPMANTTVEMLHLSPDQEDAIELQVEAALELYEASSDRQRRRQINRSLSILVHAGQLTREEATTLKAATVDPSVLDDFEPASSLAQAIVEQTTDDVAHEMGTGEAVGTIVGGLLGGAAGFLAGGPAGIAPGAVAGGMFGKAAGSLVDEAMDEDEGDGDGGDVGDGGDTGDTGGGDTGDTGGS